MSIRAAKNGSFAVLLPELTNGTKESVANELAKIFSILKRTATSIVDSAPIVILDDASQEEANSIQRYFKSVTDIDIRVHPSVSVNGEWARIKWPQRPQIDAEALTGSNVFGETFGQLDFSDSEADVGEIVFDASDPRQIESTPIELETPPPAAEPAASKPATASAPKKNSIPDFMQKHSDHNDAFCYNIFLSGLPTAAKKQRAVELICEIRGISEIEAKELISRTVAPIAKDLTEKQADKIKKMFTTSGINVRVMKKAK